VPTEPPQVQDLFQSEFSRVGASASNFELQYARLSLRSSSRCLRLLQRRLVPSTFPSATCFDSQFVQKMWEIKITFLRFIVCGIFLSSLTFFLHGRSADLFHPFPAHIETSKIFLVYFPKCPSFGIIQATHGELVFCMSDWSLCSFIADVWVTSYT